MRGEEFVQQLKQEAELYLGKLDEEFPLPRGPVSPLEVEELFRAALKNEIEAAVIAAEWVASTPELEAKLALARHAGDEARHYQLVRQYVEERGIGLGAFDPLAAPSPVLVYLRSLEGTAERIAAALVAREAMGGRRNRQFVRFLSATGHEGAARIYHEIINPEEDVHHEIGCSLLARLAGDARVEARARQAALTLLETGDRARDAFLARSGCALMPGC